MKVIRQDQRCARGGQAKPPVIEKIGKTPLSGKAGPPPIPRCFENPIYFLIARPPRLETQSLYLDLPRIANCIYACLTVQTVVLCTLTVTIIVHLHCI